MSLQENAAGKPLADMNWLLAHHRAKLSERTKFAQKIATLNPKSIIDLGCASGLWFDLLDKLLPDECDFIGIDCDEELLADATKRSSAWRRKASFIQLDIEKDANQIPPGDLTLAFNIFPYIKDLDTFINTSTFPPKKSAQAFDFTRFLAS
jgi:trans-aconitate methyltransferase